MDDHCIHLSGRMTAIHPWAKYTTCKHVIGILSLKVELCIARNEVIIEICPTFRLANIIFQ